MIFIQARNTSTTDIGKKDHKSNTQYVGINLVEPIEGGGNGIMNGIQHFRAIKGHGLFLKVSNIIRKVSSAELTIKMQQIIILCSKRLDQYIQAVSERDAYIQTLRNQKKSLQKLCDAYSAKSSSKSPDGNDNLLSIEGTFMNIYTQATSALVIQILTESTRAYPFRAQSALKMY